MNYYQGVVLEYLRADRAIFLNEECCIQLHEGENPDVTGPHWYCDALACDFRTKSVFLCEITYSSTLTSLLKRLKDWHDHWEMVCLALTRDSFLPSNWNARPWLFVPEHLIPRLLSKLEQLGVIGANGKFIPLITPLEMVQPWRYRSWNRVGEGEKLSIIPLEMQFHQGKS
jgi:hypothetical protein